MIKYCPHCKKNKEIEEFYNNSSRKDKHTAHCKLCVDKKRKDYNIINKDKRYILGKEYRKKIKENPILNESKLESQREHYKKYKVKNKKKYASYKLINRYGITIEQKEQMITNQKGLCFCCGESFGENSRNICVDHSYKTGKVRKILCRNCNVSLGYMKEDVNKILKLAEYAKYCNELNLGQ